ncbi:peptidase M48, partial [Streptomyces sp. MCAF7]
VELARTLYPGRHPGPGMPWRDWLGLLAEHRATRLLRPLAEAVRTVEKAEGISGEPPRGLTIQRVLRLLDSGRRMPLARALASRVRPPDEPEGDPLRLLAEALYVLIGAQLVARGSAHWTMNWTGPGTLVPPEGIAPETIRDWADTAVRLPGETQRLGLYVAALGVNEQAPLPGERAPDGAKGPDRRPPEISQPSKINITPGIDTPVRRRISGIRVLALTVLLGMTAVSWLLWANRGERTYPGTPGTGWRSVNPTSTYDPAAGGYSDWPTTAPSLPLPTAPIWTPGTLLRPSFDIESLVPRHTP